MIRIVGFLAILAAAATAGAATEPPPISIRDVVRADAAPRQAMTCFLTGEQTQGMNKICYYDCLGSPAAITVSAVELCPLNIKR